MAVTSLVGTARARAVRMALLLAGFMCLQAAPASAVENPWSPGTGWLSIRVGYSKVASPTAPNGGIGYGVGFRRMLPNLPYLKHLSLGGYVHHEMRGRVGAATTLDLPFTLEVARHVRWGDGIRPYVGGGYGAYSIKKYRFPDETFTLVKGGGYGLAGLDMPINSNSMLGIDYRLEFVGTEEDEYRMGLKLTYSWVY